MKGILKYTAILLCLLVVTSFVGCQPSQKNMETAVDPSPQTGGTQGEDTAPIDTQQGDGKEDAGTKPDSSETYTVPLRHEIDGRLQWEYTYSPDGRSFSKTDYTEDPPITYTVTFDENGIPQKTEWTVVVNDTRTEAWRDDYYTDSEGRITEEKRYCEGEIQNAFAYTYEENGDIATQTSRDVKQRNVIYRLLYDEMGTHIGTRYQRYNGESGYYLEEKLCTYDSNGRLLTETTASYVTEYDYIVKDGLVTSKKVTTTVGEYTWSYTYLYTYEDGKLVREDCSYGGKITDSAFYTQTKFEHYANAEKWIFRERLP